MARVYRLIRWPVASGGGKASVRVGSTSAATFRIRVQFELIHRAEYGNRNSTGEGVSLQHRRQFLQHRQLGKRPIHLIGISVGSTAGGGTITGNPFESMVIAVFLDSASTAARCSQKYSNDSTVVKNLGDYGGRAIAVERRRIRLTSVQFGNTIPQRRATAASPRTRPRCAPRESIPGPPATAVPNGRARGCRW